MIQDVRTQAMNLPALDWPVFRDRKSWLSAAILIAIVLIVVARTPNIPPAQATSTQAADGPPVQSQPAPASPPRATASTSAECNEQVWPHVASNCLQGAPDTGEPVRIVTPKPPPDAQTQAREADERYNAAMQTKPQKRKHYGDVTRERRARRNATFF